MRKDTKCAYEFGPFRVDPGKNLLFRDGQPISLPPKVFETLLVLLQRSEQVVSKGELMKTLWPDSFVEEANLTQNISLLRKALGESPQDHRYIVTAPSRGYRFSESVRVVPREKRVEGWAVPSPSPQAAVGLQRLKRDTDSGKAPVGAVVRVESSFIKRWKVIVPVSVIVLALSVGSYLFFPRRPELTAKDTIVLADFTNTTGDPVFDGTLRQGMAVQLEQSPFLSIISDGRIQHVLGMMGQRPDARLTPEIAQEICERTASAAVLQGTITSLGSQYVLGLRAKNCGTGEILDEEQVQVAKKEDVLNALGHVASRFRTRVGESLTTVEKHNTPLAEATTPSLDALKAYSAGWEVSRSTSFAAAVPFFNRAVEIDPKFAMAYAALGQMYGDIGETVLSAENADKAYQLQNRASDEERFFISHSYDKRVTGDLEKAEQTCELWAQAYPRVEFPHAFLSGMISQALGKYEGSVAEANLAIGINPDWPIVYSNLALSDVALDRLDEAGKALQRASDRKLECLISSSSDTSLVF